MYSDGKNSFHVEMSKSRVEISVSLLKMVKYLKTITNYKFYCFLKLNESHQY